ncbi:hypothetical protein G6F57_019369 [Rhizopus arrhizus]|nr:hypothetical protein G6F57_019369 [Rhizopus arrhizus]
MPVGRHRGGRAFVKSKKRTLLALTLALGAGSLGTSPAGAASWDPKIYNPMPSDDDVILPMRCEGAMAFRKAKTARNGATTNNRDLSSSPAALPRKARPTRATTCWPNMKSRSCSIKS